MRKLRKKLINIAPMATAAIALPIGFSLNSSNPNNLVVSSNIDSGSINFNGNTYGTVEEAVDAFLSGPGTVSTKVLLGDLDSATTSDEWGSVDLSKLKDPQTGTVTKMYMTLGGELTTDYDKAKRSYLQNPKVKWTDGNGNFFDSETEARNYIRINCKDQVTPIAYYEVKDHSRFDSYGNPTTVLINPLNAKDLQTLKEIAVRNFTLNSSDFELGRYSFNPYGYEERKLYAYDDKKGMNESEINATIQGFKDEMGSYFENKMWYSVEPVAVAEKDIMRLTYYSSNGGRYGKPTYFSDQCGFQWTSKGYDNTKGAFKHQIKSDAEIISNKNKMQSSYLVRENWNDYGKGVKPTSHLTTAGSSGIFGGQKMEFWLKDDSFISQKYGWFWDSRCNSIWTPEGLKSTMLWNNDVGFLGTGNKNNAWFKLRISQDGLKTAISKDPFLSQKLTQESQQLYLLMKRNMTDLLNKWGIYGNVANEIAEVIATESSKILKEQVVDSPVDTPVLKNYDSRTSKDLDATFYNLGQKAVDLLSKRLNEKYGMTLDTIFRHVITNLHGSRDMMPYNSSITQNANAKESVIYTIDHKGYPLFKVDPTVYQEVLSMPSYGTDPLGTMKSYFVNQLSRNYNVFFPKLVAGLTNVSNSYSLTSNGGLLFDSQSMVKYNDKAAAINNINFSNVEHPNNSGIDPSVKLFDESIFATQGITSNDLEKTLNRRNDDDKSLLNVPYGTLEAIFQYNKELSELFNKPYLSDVYKQNILSNSVKDLNDVVVLYNGDGTNSTIKYGEYLNFGNKFNEPLSDNNQKILTSLEERNYELEINGLTCPSKHYTFYGYNGDPVHEETINAIGGSYLEGEKQAYENALKKVSVPESEKVLFTDSLTGQVSQLDNKLSTVYVLNTTGTDGKKYQHGFTTYSRLKEYATEYVTIASSGGIIDPPPIDPSDPNVSLSSAINGSLNGIYAGIGTIVILEVVFLTALFVAKNRKGFDLYRNKNNAISIQKPLNSSSNNTLNLGNIKK